MHVIYVFCFAKCIIEYICINICISIYINTQYIKSTENSLAESNLSVEPWRTLPVAHNGSVRHGYISLAMAHIQACATDK